MKKIICRCDCGKLNMGKRYCNSQCHIKAKIEIKENECWEWQGKINHSGYGRIKMQTGIKEYMAHRVSYEAFVGKIPCDLLVCHKCDNPKCVNPSHLFLGTHKQNMEDCKKKGRNKYHILKSEDSYTRKITPEQAKEIIYLYKNTKITQTELGKKYGVSQGNIGYIVRGDTWRNLT